MTWRLFSDARCALGEGPLWHPLRGSLVWFDILGRRLYEHDGGTERSWDFDAMVSAAGWIDKTRLLVASERALFVFDMDTGTQEPVCDLEADNPVTRSNDGRADPQGGFWIGTMGKNAEPGAGAIYRYCKGELRRLFKDITISNAICFAPDGRHAYFTDTPTRIIRRVALDRQGWPVGAPEAWLDLNAEELNPDGAVVDAAGNLWNAQWGAARVACYDPDGRFLTAVAVGAGQSSCPAFGGPDLSTLYVTTAAHGAGADDSRAGAVFAVSKVGKGQAEHRVIL
ncbi:SMP-30/gluconolactonase/LRE family protein [Thalassococcus sp. CAU 1522]|uniref:SMP-30/gluconolactonase/LRE family protein n=1 Tax=Thalassococcus arenae TaxID=2851652 RepID=A0ABS6NCG7_9RHOB|nr:SMP-30/gluconolactonase/LRE family protein [Thalassococcus arenae]MBV2361707.1 SMP-30/gluconolactonase/LRE family protein [Thalassococcus arenae]